MTARRTLWGDLRNGGAVILDRISREPVLIGAALLAQYQVLYPNASQAANAAAIAWVALVQRMFTTSKKSAEENVEVAKYVGAVEEQATPGVRRE